MIVKSPLSAVLTCRQTSELLFSSEIECVVPVVSSSVNVDPSVTAYCRPNVSGVSVSG